MKKPTSNSALRDSNTRQAAALCCRVFIPDRKSVSLLRKDAKKINKYWKSQKNKMSSMYKRSSVTSARRRGNRQLLPEKCQNKEKKKVKGKKEWVISVRGHMTPFTALKSVKLLLWKSGGTFWRSLMGRQLKLGGGIRLIIFDLKVATVC